MSVLRKVFKAMQWQTSFTNTSVPWMGSTTRSGVKMSRERAMRHAAVYACIRLRAETIGSLPVHVVRHQGDRRERQPLPIWLQRPNPSMTRFEMFERTSASIDADGNAFWGFVRDRLGRILEVYVLDPMQVQVFTDAPTKTVPIPPRRFRVGGIEVNADDVLHIPGFMLPGALRAPSPIEQEMSAIGLAVAAEQFGESFFGNGAIMSGVIEAPSDPGELAVNRMRESFAKDHVGLSRAHLPGFIFGGAQWKQLTIPNNQSQFLETRKYQLGEIARIFRVPPHKIGDLDRATFSNIEHQAIEWVTDGLVPYTSRIESAVKAAGLLEGEDEIKFNFAGMLRGDTASRFAAYAVARQWGWLSADDIRAFEDMNPLPDGQGETYLEPMNMVPAGTTSRETSTPEVARALRAAGVDRQLVTAATGHDVPEED